VCHRLFVFLHDVCYHLVQHATGYSKLEKADILELAVKYLRNIRGQQISGIIIINVKLMSNFHPICTFSILPPTQR